MSFDILYVLRLKGLASTEALGEATGIDAPAAAEMAFALERDGLVCRRAGHIAGWSLTPAGRDLLSRLLAKEQADLSQRSEIEACYRAFLFLDEPFKEVCTAWQLRDRSTLRSNDHSDPDYDAAVIARLTPLHARASAIACDLAEVLRRFRSYKPRMARAYDRLIGGDERWLTTPMIGSYHDVWMELHEDLLMTLGRTR